MFRLEPDLLLESTNHKWVLDTKWKKLDAADRGNKYGLSQGDFYQLYAYGKKYLAGQASSELVLIYPATESFSKSLPVFDYGDGMKLWVLPFDLKKQFLVDFDQTSLPIDVRLPDGVKKVEVRARGVERVISPVGQRWDEFFQQGPRASDDFMAERAAQVQPEREGM